MAVRAPHFLLMSETTREEDQDQWRFVLASTDGEQKLVASDSEPETQGERLELLSVVRGLEALEQPSQVTLLTDSRYVSQGIAHGISEWRSNDWCWERFGELTPVKNIDLWRRVDRALKFHRVDCRTWRFDSAHTAVEAPAAAIADARLPQANAATALVSRSAEVRPSGAEASQRTNSPARSERSSRRPKSRGMLATCRNWIEQAAVSVRGLQTGTNLETI